MSDDRDLFVQILRILERMEILLGSIDENLKKIRSKGL